MNAGTIEEHEAFMEKFETVNGKRLYGKQLRAYILQEKNKEDTTEVDRYLKIEELYYAYVNATNVSQIMEAY